jgi:hypothetical protein
VHVAPEEQLVAVAEEMEAMVEIQEPRPEPIPAYGVTAAFTSSEGFENGKSSPQKRVCLTLLASRA